MFNSHSNMDVVIFVKIRSNLIHTQVSQSTIVGLDFGPCLIITVAWIVSISASLPYCLDKK